jgi:acylphosphatase
VSHRVLCEKWIVTGRVQNVGFRYYSMQCAKRYDIRGAARNCSDGSVEIIVQGERNNLEIYYDDINKGPALSKVHSILRTPCSEQTFDPDEYDIVFSEVHDT